MVKIEAGPDAIANREGFCWTSMQFVSKRFLRAPSDPPLDNEVRKESDCPYVGI